MELDPSIEYTAYLAFEGFEKELATELGFFISQLGRLFLTEGPVQSLIWAQDTWAQCRTIKIDSITHGTRQLKNHLHIWTNYAFDLHRRSSLIQENLHAAKNRPLKFLEDFKIQKFGCWTLVDQNTVLYTTNPRSSIPLGEVRFEEDKVFPPSRAYLKLWELFTVYQIKPQKGQRVVDLGSCPGGWTWVLQQLGCHVLSVDKAPLDPKIAKLPKIEYIKKDAFKLTPQDLGEVDWLFSDIICYPSKLFEYLEPWINLPVNLACTIKFQGRTDYQTLSRFKNIPNSQVLHLFHNKHEVTFIRLK